MSGVGEAALDQLTGGNRGGPPPDFPFCRFPGDRPKLATTDKGLIYDAATSQILIWNANRWEKESGAPVESLTFPQIEPRFAGVPRMGVGVTCLPGTWAGYPAPVLSFKWFVDGAPYPGASAAQFGRNADELAFLYQGREIRCVVSARQMLTPPPGASGIYNVETVGLAVDYIRPALPAS